MSGADASGTGVDFHRSSCRWRLRDEDSVGQFALDAVLRVGERDAECFVLTAQVFAGNVYAGENLFKHPPYGYAAAFSAARYRIFRDPVRDAGNTADSIGSNAELLRSVTIDLRERRVRSVSPGELAGASLEGLCARIELPKLALEFPVRHFNVGVRGFQVETGPVLTLEEGDGEPIACLRRAYVNFGRLDRAEFLLDSPRGAGASGRWTKRAALDCVITLLRAAA